jgi:hypothetical protein
VDQHANKVSPPFDAIAASLEGTGLIYRGGFHPRPVDRVPVLADGRAVETVLLIGNAGGALWRAFTEAVPDRAVPNPLDRWLNPILEQLSDRVGGELVLPNRGPDFPPIQDWAMRAEPVHRSPSNCRPAGPGRARAIAVPCGLV